MHFEKGARVNTPLGPGTVAYVRMRPPDYAEPDAVSVVLDSRTDAAPWYTGTIFAAHKVTQMITAATITRILDATYLQVNPICPLCGHRFTDASLPEIEQHIKDTHHDDPR